MSIAAPTQTTIARNYIGGQWRSSDSREQQDIVINGDSNPHHKLIPHSYANVIPHTYADNLFLFGLPGSNGHRIANGCSIPNSCNGPKTCTVAKSCNTMVRDASHSYGSLTGNVTLSFDSHSTTLQGSANVKLKRLVLSVP